MVEIKRGFRGIKGLNIIKTTTGIAGSKGVKKPHEAFREISCLEMEKQRLDKEKKIAESRIDLINNRFKEIERKRLALFEFIERPDMDNKKKKKRNKPEPMPLHRISSGEIRERIITY